MKIGLSKTQIAVIVLIVLGGLIPVAHYWYYIGRVPGMHPWEARESVLSEDSNSVIVDIRSEEEFAISHLEGAYNWPYEDIMQHSPSAPVPEQFKGKKLLLLCEAGIRSAFAAQRLQAQRAIVMGNGYVQDLGAARVVDYEQVDFRDSVRSEYPDGVDVVFDCVCGDVLARSAEIVRPGGRLISIVDDPTGLARGDIHKEFVFVAPNSKQLTALARMVEQGRLNTHLSQVFPFGLEEAQKAHELSESLRTRGKMVLVL